ncbi:hypothetical protein [Streptomyces caelestis]|uniref:Cysteinyl-tRNA synthetase n=1 Tax=Streptomyces caelestis TaxID=36816 RepID=A0A7W9LRF1_9ACTN|nr:hypothetical protein [Streptomyces caelestis]MBB5793242.1 hypothetical protein [Streptomyces caelestis]
MLRIIDAHSGEPVDAAPARRGLTRVEVHAPGSDTTNLRVLLVADVLVRALELGGTPVWALLTGGRRQAELRADAAALGIRPFEDSPDVGAGLGEAQVVHVVTEGGAVPEGVRIAVAPVEVTGPGPSGGERREAGRSDDGSADLDLPLGGAAESDPSGDGFSEPSPPSGRTEEERPVGQCAGSDPANGQSGDSGPLGGGVDPTVLRLALLTGHHNTPVRLDAGVLDEARATLARWRGAVARWARQPSRPVPDEVRGRLREAWEDDLDVPRVLDELRRVENERDLPDGARFETYAYADRLLGLELTRDLGAPS